MPVAIDVGSRNLHLVEGGYRNGVVTILRTGTEALPTASVTDGIIRDTAGFEMALKSALARHGLSRGGVILTVNSNQVFQKEFEIPKAKPKAMADIVRFEVMQSIGINRDMSVTYTILPDVPGQDPAKVRVRAAAFQADAVQAYYKALKTLGLRPVAMDIHSNALAKLFRDAVVNGRPMAGRTVLLADIGGSTTSVYILANGEIIYTRIIPSGGMELERYVLAYNNQQLEQGGPVGMAPGQSALEDMPGTPPRKAAAPEAAPREPLTLDALDLSLESLKANPLLADAIRPLFSSLADNIQRIVQFQKARMDGFKIETVYLAGGIGRLKGAAATLAGVLDLPTETIVTHSRIQPGAAPLSPALINAAAALIRLD